jgi:type IV pilus assembly protein PilW
MSKNPRMTAMHTPGPVGRLPQMGAIRQHGLTLIELMVSLMLGLVLIGGVLNIFVSNREAHRVNENLTRMQENARTGFDFMARDLREAGQNPCGTKLMANLIRKTGAIPWWADWNKGTVIGLDGSQNRTDLVAFGTGLNARVAGTDAVLVTRAAQDEKIITLHNPATFEITLGSVTGLAADDVVIGCDLKNAAIFQIGVIDTGAKVIEYNPIFANLNCSGAKLGYPAPLSCTSLTNKVFDAGGMVSKLNTSFWYVGYGTGGKRALYRTRIIAKTISGLLTITTEPEEMIPGVQDLQIEYLTRNVSTGILATAWVDATDGTSFPGATSTLTGNWQTDDPATQPLHVVATRITMTLQSEDNVGTDQLPLQRQLIHVVGLRSRDSSL